MWPILLLSLTLFGANQYLSQNSNNEEADRIHHGSTKSNITLKNDTLKKVENRADIPPPITAAPIPTTTKEPDYYSYFDPVTKKEYQIPKLGGCKPVDGYRFIAGPDNEGFSQEQDELGESDSDDPAPQPFKMKYGFTWDNAPDDDDLLERLNNTEVADKIRKEIQAKSVLIAFPHGSLNLTWEYLTDPQSRDLQGFLHYHPMTSQLRDGEIYPEHPYRIFLFQPMFKCGVYRVYTPLVAFIEFDQDSGVYHMGEQVFYNTKECHEIFKKIHTCKYVFEWE